MSYLIGGVVGFALGLVAMSLAAMSAICDAEAEVWRSNMDKVLDAEAEAEAMRGMPLPPEPQP